MRKITIKNVTPENKSKNRLQKVFSFPESGDIARDIFGWVRSKVRLHAHESNMAAGYVELL